MDRLVYRKFFGEDTDASVSVRSSEYKDEDAGIEGDYGFMRTRIQFNHDSVFANSEPLTLDFVLTSRLTPRERQQTYEEAIVAMETLKFAANAVMDSIAGQFAVYEEAELEADRLKLAEKRAEHDDDVPF